MNYNSKIKHDKKTGFKFCFVGHFYIKNDNVTNIYNDCFYFICKRGKSDFYI